MTITTHSRPSRSGRNIKILYWNCKSYQQLKGEILSVFHHYNIRACVETWLTEDLTAHLSEFITYRKDLPSNGGPPHRDPQHAALQRGRREGIIFFNRSDLAYEEIMHHAENIESPCPSVEIFGIKVTNTIPTFDLFLCYRAPGVTLSQGQWDTIFKNFRRNKFLAVGHLDSHSFTWNCDSNDLNGVILE